MATEPNARDYEVWGRIEREKRIDRRLRRISVAAWTITIVLTLVFAVLTGLQISQFIGPAVHGQLPMAVIAGAAFPLLIVLGLLSTLIATLTTVGIFLRMRTASLHEIQLRLAALEAMMTRDDAPGQ